MRVFIFVAMTASAVLQFAVMAEAIGTAVEASSPLGWAASRAAGLGLALVPLLGGAAAAFCALGWLGWGWPAALALFFGPFLVAALATWVAAWGAALAPAAAAPQAALRRR